MQIMIASHFLLLKICQTVTNIAHLPLTGDIFLTTMYVLHCDLATKSTHKRMTGFITKSSCDVPSEEKKLLIIISNKIASRQVKESAVNAGEQLTMNHIINVCS